MNQAQLRPPKRVYQGLCAWLGIPGVLYLVFALHMHPLQQKYFWSYAKVSLLPDMNGRISGHPTPRPRTLYCVRDGVEEDAPAIEGMRNLQGLHPAAFPMTTAAYMSWLQTYIFHAPFWGFCFAPLIWSAEILLAVFVVAWKIDRYRHLKFRSTPRHIRGSRLVTRTEFRKYIKGEASGWWTRQCAPKKIREAGLGWRTEDYQEQE